MPPPSPFHLDAILSLFFSVLVFVFERSFILLILRIKGPSLFSNGDLIMKHSPYIYPIWILKNPTQFLMTFSDHPILLSSASLMVIWGIFSVLRAIRNLVVLLCCILHRHGYHVVDLPMDRITHPSICWISCHLVLLL